MEIDTQEDWYPLCKSNNSGIPLSCKKHRKKVSVPYSVLVGISLQNHIQLILFGFALSKIENLWISVHLSTLKARWTVIFDHDKIKAYKSRVKSLSAMDENWKQSNSEHGKVKHCYFFHMPNTLNFLLSFLDKAKRKMTEFSKLWSWIIKKSFLIHVKQVIRKEKIFSHLNNFLCMKN